MQLCESDFPCIVGRARQAVARGSPSYGYVEADLQDYVKIGQSAVGSDEKAPPEHRLDPLNLDVDTINFVLKIASADGPAYQGGQPSRSPRPFGPAKTLIRI